MKYTAIAAILAAAFVGQTALSQDGDIQFSGGVQVQSIGGPEGGLLTEGAVGMFSPLGGGVSFGSSFGGVDPNSGSQLFSLLSNESVRAELKLTEEQFDGSQKIMKESRKRMGDYVRSMMSERKSGTSIQIDGQTMKTMTQEASAQAEAAIEEILLPVQLKRIRQLAYQIEVRQNGLGEFLVDGRLGQDVDVHDDQKQHLTDRAAAIEAEARAAIIKIRSEAQAKLLAELAPDQRKTAEGLLGKYFEYEELSLSQQLQKQMKSLREKAKPPAVEK